MRTKAEIERAIAHLEGAMRGAVRAGDEESEVARCLRQEILLLRWVNGEDNCKEALFQTYDAYDASMNRELVN